MCVRVCMREIKWCNHVVTFDKRGDEDNYTRDCTNDSLINNLKRGAI